MHLQSVNLLNDARSYGVMMGFEEFWAGLARITYYMGANTASFSISPPLPHRKKFIQRKKSVNKFAVLSISFIEAGLSMSVKWTVSTLTLVLLCIWPSTYTILGVIGAVLNAILG